MVDLVKTPTSVTVEPKVTEVEIALIEGTTVEILEGDHVVEVISPSTEIEINTVESTVEVSPIHYTVEINSGSAGDGIITPVVKDYFNIIEVDVTNITYVPTGDAEDAVQTMTFDNGVVLTFAYSSGNPNPELNGLLTSISNAEGKAILYGRDAEGRYITITYGQLGAIQNMTLTDASGNEFIVALTILDESANEYSIDADITDETGQVFTLN